MLLITDLDGTLLTSQKTISPRTRQALIAFRQDGGLLAGGMFRQTGLLNGTPATPATG